MPCIFRAAWVLPVAGPPIENGWVAVDRGRILAAGGPDTRAPDGVAVEAPFDRCAILPGLVNAHTHLELSWMRGQVPPADSMPAWVGRLMALRRTVSHEPPGPLEAAVREVRASGTALVGDISNTLASFEPLLESELSAVIFRELLGFNTPDPSARVAQARQDIDALMPVEWLRARIVPHAPYSVSAPLFREIAAANPEGPLSIHLGESEDEIRFLQEGTGAWKRILENVGAWDESWRPPRCRPVEYLDRLGLVTGHLLAVHGVWLTDAELQRLAAAGATLVTCPRSNRWTGAGIPPIPRFYASGVRVAVGTDSLAGVEDLNVFAELAEARRLAPGVSARRLLESATRRGAEALGFAADLGTIEAGKRAELLAVRIPPSAGDVEEYLVQGVPPADLRWLV